MHAGLIGDTASADGMSHPPGPEHFELAVTPPDPNCKMLHKSTIPSRRHRIDAEDVSHLSGYLSHTEEVETRRYRILRCNLRLRHANLRRFRVPGSSIGSSRQAASWPYRVSAKKSRREMLQDAALKPSTSTSRMSGTSAHAARVAPERRWSHKGAPRKLQ
jgi:hypothetical protein